jgi:thioredoxin 1
MGEFIEIREDNFEEQVIQAPLPVILEFGGQCCRPCKTLEPLLAHLAKEWAGKVKLAKVEVENSPNLAVRFNVMCVPTMILFKDGEARATLTGLHSLERIRKIFLPYIEDYHG